MPFQCTEAEWKIMEILWDASPRSMPEITKLLAPATGWTRHTVITLLKRMQEKGTVSVDETGSVKMYTPLVSREAARSDQTHKLLNRVFSGNASLLMNTLVDSGEITVKEMEELVELLKSEGKKKRRGRLFGLSKKSNRQHSAVTEGLAVCLFRSMNHVRSDVFVRRPILGEKSPLARPKSKRKFSLNPPLFHECSASADPAWRWSPRIPAARQRSLHRPSGSFCSEFCVPGWPTSP